jgi:superfamily II DNA or RNA helicase
MTFDLKLSTLPKQYRDLILKTLIVKPSATQYEPSPIPYDCYVVNKEKDTISLPLGVWQQYLSKFPNTQQYDKINKNVKFIKNLLTIDTDPDKRGRDQDVIVKTALNRLDKYGSVFLSIHTGGGKTAQSIYLSINLGLKTVILSHLDVVKQQWAEEYENFAPGIKTQFLNKPNCKLDPDADVYIIGIQKAFISNFDFSKIGTVIVDEAHIATVTAFTQTLFKFCPRYLIGLSATPNRSDGLDILFNLYFGAKEEFIIRKEKKDFIVYKVETEFEPRIEYKNVKGRQTVNWNTVVQSIEENPDRWRLIVDIVLNHPRHKIIILCNRKILSNGIYNLLIEKGEDAELLIESKKKWNKDARVLVAGFKKGGVGLNDPKLTMAIIASDTKDSRQYEGRIRTVNNIIYHIVDCYNPLQNHYKACEKFYIEKGATIELITKYNIMIQKYYYNYLLLKYMDIDVVDIKDEILTFFICSLID